jgi:glycosyltransferase involved in cell wall biosynthesis
MNSTNYYFTVFTPVYNGAKHLLRVFDSIDKQLFKDFQWIVVDDGSTDDSADLISTFISKRPSLNAIFIRQENKGKHQSWNTAVELASSVLFVPADADDSFEPNALSFFHEKWTSFSENERERLSGINVLCFDNDSNAIVGNKFPFDAFWSNNLELYYKLGLYGEKWGCIRTDLLKTRQFPIIQGSFYPENYLWLFLAKSYHVVCYNVALRRYYTTDTGLTMSGKRIKRSENQARVQLHYLYWFCRNFGFFALWNAPFEIFRMMVGGILDLGIVLRSKLASLKRQQTL